MTNKFSYILIDGTNLWWRCFSTALKKLFVKKEFELFPGAIKEALTRIDHIKNIFGYNDSLLYICFDNPESVLNVRKYIDENYKSHRFKKNSPKGLYQTLNIFIEILKYYSDNFRILSVSSLEADDLTKPLIESYKEIEISKKNKCLVISSDLDWSRNLALSEYCYWWNFHKLYDREAFKEEFEFYPVNEKIQLYKAIHGDASDNIENAVPYLPHDLLIRIINEFNSVDELYKGLFKTDYPQNWKIKLKENERDVRKNLDLVNFIPIDLKIEDHLIECKQNVKALKFFYDCLGLDYEPFMRKTVPLFQKIRNKII